MFSHSEPIDAGIKLRSVLTDQEYVVVDNYDPTDIRKQATVKIAPVGMLDQAFSVAADSIEQNFHPIR